MVSKRNGRRNGAISIRITRDPSRRKQAEMTAATAPKATISGDASIGIIQTSTISSTTLAMLIQDNQAQDTTTMNVNHRRDKLLQETMTTKTVQHTQDKRVRDISQVGHVQAME